jgi:hypothetical protein
MSRFLLICRRWAARAALGACAASVATVGLAAYWIQTSPIEFHQSALERLWITNGVQRWATLGRTLVSSATGGAKALWNWPASSLPNLDDPKEVAAWILSWAPSRAYVYTTEEFYYFTFPTEDGLYRGNLRLADLPRGYLSVSYFKHGTVGHPRTARISTSDGLEIEQLSDTEFVVGLEGASARFDFLGPRWQDGLPQVQGSMALGRIVDESGVVFILWFDKASELFFVALDRGWVCADSFVEPRNGFFLGERTGFLYLEDEVSDTWQLVGVDYDHIILNDYFDGPGDQVPIRADLFPGLVLAYPQVQLGEGIERNGVYLGRDNWMRIAVCPFGRYVTLAQCMDRVEARRLEQNLPGFITKEWWNSDRWRAGVLKKLAAQGTRYDMEAEAARLAWSIPSN